MIELDVFKQKLEEDKEHLPLLTLDEFFAGNPEEDSIVPNQWGRKNWKKQRIVNGCVLMV